MKGLYRRKSKIWRVYSSEEETLILYALYRRRKRSLRKPRRFWTRSIYSQRKQLGCYSTLVQEMRLNDPEMHFRYFRMSKERFDDLLHKVCTTHLAIYGSILSTLLWLTGRTHATDICYTYLFSYLFPRVFFCRQVFVCFGSNLPQTRKASNRFYQFLVSFHHAHVVEKVEAFDWLNVTLAPLE